MSEIKNILAKYEGITLKEMDSVSLLNRIDSKFVFASLLLPDILEATKDHYRVLTIDKKRIFSYRSLYFDTDGNTLYLDHHNGKPNRYKIRFRTYIESDLSYLEIKFKTKNGRTIKNRVKTGGIETELSDASWDYIRQHLPPDVKYLEPKIYTDFKRVTLVNKKLTERITVDFQLRFENSRNVKELPNLSIIELKQDGVNANRSELVEILDKLGILPGGMSKYCIGRVLIEEDIKYNQFKRNLLLINKIENHDHSAVRSA